MKITKEEAAEHLGLSVSADRTFSRDAAIYPFLIARCDPAGNISSSSRVLGTTCWWSLWNCTVLLVWPLGFCSWGTAPARRHCSRHAALHGYGAWQGMVLTVRFGVLLQLDDDLTQDVIKQAFREMALKW